jgi:hypothetical protein
LAWLIIMGSGFDEWVYWHFFTIPLNYKSSHTELLHDVCLTNDVWRISDWSLLLPNSSQSNVTTDGQSAGLSYNKAPIRVLRPDLYYCMTVAGFFIWDPLSNERTGLSFAIAADPRQHNHFLVFSPVGLATIFYCLRFDSRIHECTVVYNCHAAEIEVTLSNTSSLLLCCHGNAFVSIRCRGKKCFPSRCLAKRLPLLLLFHILSSVYISVA